MSETLKQRVDRMLAASEVPNPIAAAFVLGREYEDDEQQNHEGIIEQMERLERDFLAPSPHGQDVEANLYEIAAKADPSHAWHHPTPDGRCIYCGYDATDPEASEPCSWRPVPPAEPEGDER